MTKQALVEFQLLFKIAYLTVDRLNVDAIFNFKPVLLYLNSDTRLLQCKGLFISLVEVKSNY